MHFFFFFFPTIYFLLGGEIFLNFVHIAITFTFVKKILLFIVLKANKNHCKKKVMLLSTLTVKSCRDWSSRGGGGGKLCWDEPYPPTPKLVCNLFF